jgi:hypothetical protein
MESVNLAVRIIRTVAPPDLAKLISPGYWFDGFTGPPTPYTFILLGLFGLAMLASAGGWLFRRRLFPGHRVKVRLAARLGPWFFGLAATGVALLLLRVAQSPILTTRFLWLLCGASLVGLFVYLLWYLRERYPAEVAAFEREELRRQFMPRPKGRRRRR